MSVALQATDPTQRRRRGVRPALTPVEAKATVMAALALWELEYQEQAHYGTVLGWLSRRPTLTMALELLGVPNHPLHRTALKAIFDQHHLPSPAPRAKGGRRR